jgi:hypothetical protein
MEARSTPKPTMRRVNTSMTTSTPVTAQKDGFAAEQVGAPQAILRVCHEGQPRGAVGSGVAWPVVLREHASNDVLVKLDTEGVSDLLGDAHAAEPWIAALQLDDRRDECCRRTFGAGFTATVAGGKEPTILPLHQGLAKPEQCCRLDEHAKLRNPAWAHEQRDQSEHRVIERGQIRRPASRAITDLHLILDQTRLCHDGAQATGAQQFEKGDQQVDGEDEEFAHGANRTITAKARKTPPHRRIPSYCEFATHRSPDAQMVET